MLLFLRLLIVLFNFAKWPGPQKWMRKRVVIVVLVGEVVVGLFEIIKVVMLW